MNDKEWLEFSKFMREIMSFTLNNKCKFDVGSSRIVYGKKGIKLLVDFNVIPQEDERVKKVKK